MLIKFPPIHYVRERSDRRFDGYVTKQASKQLAVEMLLQGRSQGTM